MRFEKKVVVITGAGSGIGAATAKRFYDEGASLALIGRSPAKLETTATEFDRARYIAIAADVSDAAAVASAASVMAERFGRIDVLVNSAGVGAVGSFLDDPTPDWQTMMSINVGGVINITRALLPHLLSSQGAIVNVSSVSGLGGDRGLSFYNATKGAVTNLTRSLALEFAGQGVRINAVCPGVTFTEMNRDAFEQYPALLQAQLERIALGRGAAPSEIAATIAFLASADASFIHGVNLPVDGGLMAANGQAPFL